ncbi:MAG: xanthine dehydrogenase family protein subunit M [Hyphomicrobiales bacterium]|nr:xanthine dehydrogenase family protein subunit M [Hyphomicrobiales bacterium]MCP4997960.1 xanthine dehydrogenase family protein subunit M [Hyphomicrobiales bacterium]
MQLQYFRPDDLDSAIDWLSENNACVAAGCTDLLAATTDQKLSGPVLDLTAIGDLRGISEDERGWRFGATTTWTDVIEADLPPAFDSLKLAAREVGSIQIQNSGTLAGNLCNASPAADSVPCWLTLKAEIELKSSGGVRRLPLLSFITGPRETALQSGEIVTAILVPQSAAEGISSYLKLGARKYLVISIAMVAVRLLVDSELVSEAAISVGSCNAVATRLSEAEAFLEGKRLSKETIEQIPDGMLTDVLQPIDDLRSDAAYRRVAAGELVRRCIGSLIAGEAVAV